jgi:hypothetical protein
MGGRKWEGRGGGKVWKVGRDLKLAFLPYNTQCKVRHFLLKFP